MEKMTPKRARALPELRAWTIDTFSSGLPSAFVSPQKQDSGEVPEHEAQEREQGLLEPGGPPTPSFLMAIVPDCQAPVCLGGDVLLGPLGPMVRGRTLVPVALGRACLLPPNGVGCQPQRLLCIPMVPTGHTGNLSLGEFSHLWDHGTGSW